MVTISTTPSYFTGSKVSLLTISLKYLHFLPWRLSWSLPCLTCLFLCVLLLLTVLTIDSDSHYISKCKLKWLRRKEWSKFCDWVNDFEPGFLYKRCLPWCALSLLSILPSIQITLYKQSQIKTMRYLVV